MRFPTQAVSSHIELRLSLLVVKTLVQYKMGRLGFKPMGLWIEVRVTLFVGQAKTSGHWHLRDTHVLPPYAWYTKLRHSCWSSPGHKSHVTVCIVKRGQVRNEIVRRLPRANCILIFSVRLAEPPCFEQGPVFIPNGPPTRRPSDKYWEKGTTLTGKFFLLHSPLVWLFLAA